MTLLAAACTGEIRRADGTPGDGDAGPGGPEDGGPGRIDGGVTPDGAAPPADGGPGGAPDGGEGEADAGTVDPCAEVTCGTNEECDPATGACACRDGFADMGAGCVAVPPGDPAGRTEAEVCAAWRAGHVESSGTPWTAGGTECDLGTLHADAIDDTVRRVSLFRWLAGLGAVTDDPARQSVAQHCAVLMAANGRISHTPDSSWDCYTAEGEEGAGSSNLALGVGTPAFAIDLYMRDYGTPSLGHRRWILNDPLGKVSVGFAGTAQCLGIFDSSGTSDRDWTAYPNPGPAPVETSTDLWSLHSRRLSLAGADVTVERVSDGAALPVTVSHPPEGYGPGAVAWDPNGWTPVAGERYRVTITGVSGGPIAYVVHLVSCG